MASFLTELATVHSCGNLLTQDVQITESDVNAISHVVASDHSEEDLLSCPRQLQAENTLFLIKAGSATRLQPMENEDLGKNASFTVPREIRGVKELSRGADNGWIDVLVPGFCKCQTHLASLTRMEDTVEAGAGISTLVLMFEEDPQDDVLCAFLGVVGGPLQFLTLQVAAFRTCMLERITAICPRLREIAICTPAMEVRFRVRLHKQVVVVPPEAPSSFEDVTKLVECFREAALPFAQSVRRLRIRCGRRYGTTTPPLKESCALLMVMLQENRTLEYLDVVSSGFYPAFALLFNKSHLETLPVPKNPLPVGRKLGFISVMATVGDQAQASREPKRTRSSIRARRFPELDRNVAALIFEFAATPVQRNVYYRGYSDEYSSPI